MVYQIKNKDDLTELLKTASDKLIVIDFCADWCGPCKRISPKIDELAEIYAETALILKVDVDDCEEIAFEFDISSMPTFVFMKNGEIIDSIIGANEENLALTFSKHINKVINEAATSAEIQV